MVIFDVLFTQNELVMDVQVEQFTAGGIVPQVVFDAGIMLAWSGQQRLHLMLAENLTEKRAVLRVYEKIEVGTAVQRLS